VRPIALVALLEACGDGGGLVRVPVSGRFEPDALDFGDVPVGGSTTITTELVNSGEVAIADVEVTQSDPSFTIRVIDSIVVPGQRGRIGSEPKASEVGRAGFAGPGPDGLIVSKGGGHP
jgi:hypothetical protein